ncbi:MAG: HAMP domain-containing histidine kinase [Lachnospiraceae bacterium]|nr:HAMP domain-containing histidine kinase [Lachnospiraceae bacterium]
MDWLEEKWESFKTKIRNTSLLRGLLCYFFMGFAAALVFSLLTRNICKSWIFVIGHRHPPRIWVQDQCIVSFLYDNSFYIYVLMASGIAVWMFFRNKIYPAIQALREALNNLAIGDYSHEIQYRSEDELGSLCGESEYLRLQLIKEKREQWEEEEDQRSINAAFAHDMRTPLTVMKGYTEYLLKYIPQGKIGKEILLEKLNVMQSQQERLITFTGTMTRIRQIEKRAVNGKWVKLSEFMKSLNLAIKALAKTREEINCCIEFDGEPNAEIFIDVEMVLEVFENLLHNAIRYAHKKIEIRVQAGERNLVFFVRDDGKGFTQRALRAAWKVYYSEAKEDGEHFGMGLFICKTLCEKHGGKLILINSVEGGAIVTAEFLCRYR